MATGGNGETSTRTPRAILDDALRRASSSALKSLVGNEDIISKAEYVCRFLGNRAGVRLLLACSLAKVHNPKVDIRKPYTAIGDTDAYSGRTYDEQFISAFITEHNLPCNPTTAFLTPALRNRNITLTPDIDLVGNYPKLYQTALQLLTDVHEGKVSADDLLALIIRWLLIIRDERALRMETLLAGALFQGYHFLVYGSYCDTHPATFELQRCKPTPSPCCRCCLSSRFKIFRRANPTA